MLAPLAFIFFFSFRIDRMSASSARTMFLAFSAVMGLSLSSILLVYTKQSSRWPSSRRRRRSAR